VKAITLWQPWATLIALNLKHFETRSWATNYRGPLAIHAAKRKADNSEMNDTIRKCLMSAGYEHYVSDLPYGCVVCTVTLAAVYPTEQATNLPFFAIRERWFGDFTPGRFAWRLDNVLQVANAPARGSQGFWEWQP